MTVSESIAASTPVLVGAGQVVRREAGSESPMALAAAASRAALAHSGGTGLAEAIDTVSVTRLFSESMGFMECSFGRSDNPPMSVASAIGATPRECIYGHVGGNEPLSRLIEFARDIARGERSVVLLAGAEATYNQRSAERAGETLDWNDSVEGPLEDRGWGKLFVSEQEIANGMLAPIFYFGLIEQAQATASGHINAHHQESMAALLTPLSQMAQNNPYAQFPSALSEEEILETAPLNQLYSKRMVARDVVNQGAALLMCSVQSARELGIPEENWIYLHGLAEGDDVNLSERPSPDRSLMMDAVLDQALLQARRSAAQMDLIDLYSCFPCAIFAGAAHLGLPVDGSRALSLTGGLPFFGGPGNNYAMHSLAEAVSRLRADPRGYALVTAIGGVLSKHTAGVFSREPSDLDWGELDTCIDTQILPRQQIDANPTGGKVISYVVNYHRGHPSQVMVLAETNVRRRFVACNAFGDNRTVATMLAFGRAGRSIDVTPGQNGALHFTLST